VLSSQLACLSHFYLASDVNYNVFVFRTDFWAMRYKSWVFCCLSWKLSGITLSHSSAHDQHCMWTESFCVNLVLCLCLFSSIYIFFFAMRSSLPLASTACHNPFLSPLLNLNFSSSSQVFISYLWWRGGEAVGRDVLPLGKYGVALPCDKEIVLQELHEWFLHSGGIVTF